MRAQAARGFSTPTLKIVLAALFAIGGIGYAGYIFLGSGGGEKNEPRTISTSLDDEGNAVDPNYTKARSSKQIEQVSGEISQKIQNLGGAIDVIRTVSGQGSEGIAQAAVDALIPLISDDHNGFIAAIAAMGGKIGELDGDHPLFTHLTKVFKHASVDVDRITVSKYEPEERRGGMIQREVTEDEDVASEDATRQSTRERVMQMKPASLFPDAPDRDDESAIEVRIPMKPKGEGESIFGLILTWNADARKWQPAAYSVIKREIIEEDG